MKASRLMEMKTGFVSSERVYTQTTIGSLVRERAGPHLGAKQGSLACTRSLVHRQLSLRVLSTGHLVKTTDPLRRLFLTPPTHGCTLVCFHIGFVHLPKVEIEFLEHLYKDNAHGDSCKSTGHAQEVHQAHVAPLPEEDGGSQQDQRGKHDVVDGPEHRGVEALQGLVDVPELDDDAAAQDSQEHKAQAEGPLTGWIVVQDVLGRQPNALGGRHSETPQQGADADVDHDVGGPVGRRNPEDQQQQHEQYNAQVTHKHCKTDGTP